MNTTATPLSDRPKDKEKLMPTFKQVGDDYQVVLNGSSLKLNARQAASLLYQMLRILPDVDLNTRHVLHRMLDPHEVTVVYYKAENGQVIESHRRKEIRCDTDETVIHDVVSKTKAESDAVIQEAEAFCKANGMTMKELMALMDKQKEETDVL